MHEKIPQFDGMPIKTLCRCHSITHPISTPNDFLVYLFIGPIYAEYISMLKLNCYTQKEREREATYTADIQFDINSPTYGATAVVVLVTM